MQRSGPRGIFVNTRGGADPPVEGELRGGRGQTLYRDNIGGPGAPHSNGKLACLAMFVRGW